MISFDHVSFHYGGENGSGDGVNNIKLDIRTGELIVLCGESGCGKTTLTRLVNGLAGNFYEGELKGKVYLDALCISDASLPEIASHVGSVFQNPKSQFFNLDTTGELAFGCENLGCDRDEIKRRLDKTRRDMQLDSLMDRNIFELSGGEKQQIACGSVYAADPEVYVMDEPSSNLDRKAVRRLHGIIKKMKEGGKTLIISEHRLHYLIDIADRFVYMKNGSIDRIMSSEEMKALSDEDLRELGLRCTDLKSIRIGEQLESLKSSSKDIWSSAVPALEAVDLSCSRGNARIVDIDRFALPQNSIVAVIGDNGCGKSTLTEALCGLLPSSGSVALEGRFLSARERSEKCFMVMQDVNRQLFSESVKEEIMLGCDIDENRAMELLDSLALGDYGERHPASLSGGQKQRVAIASALCAGKDMILYDEPTSGLDRRGMELFGALLRDLRGSAKLSMIITHDPELILQCCTHVLHMENGRVSGFYALDEEGVERVLSYFISESDENSGTKRVRTSAIGKILKYAGENRKTVYASALLILIAAAASIVPYILVYRILSGVLAGEAMSLESCIPAVCGVLGCRLLHAVFYTYGLQLSHRAAFRTLENIRIYLQSMMEQKPLGSLEEMGKGSIKKLFTDDVESIELILAHIIPEGFANTVVPLAVLFVLTVIDWRLMLLTAAVLLLAVSVSKQMVAIGMDQMGNYFASTKRLNNTIVEYVNGMEVVRVFNRHNESGERYEKRVRDYKDYALGWYRVCWSWMALYGSLFSNLTLYTLPFGALLILTGKLSLSAYILVLCLSFGISPMLVNCMSFLSAVPQVNFKLQALEKALDRKPLRCGDQPFGGSSCDIEFKDVHFAYRDKEVLKGVSFTARQNEMTALVGASGSGKSTIARLIVHHYDAGEGRISIGGQPVGDMSLEALNSKISYVSQDLFLFNRSILENIRIGRPSASDGEVREAAKKACCDEFINELENGYDTLAGSSGSKLSGGQRQRICFARAILKDSPIVVLDEATAFIDAENEEKMASAIRELVRSKTVIVIAHKLRSIEGADNIIVLDEGRIRACGRHDELLESDGLYSRLWDLSEAASGWTVKEESEAEA